MFFILPLLIILLFACKVTNFLAITQIISQIFASTLLLLSLYFASTFPLPIVQLPLTPK